MSVPVRGRQWGAMVIAFLLAIGLTGAFSPATATPLPGTGSITGMVSEAGGDALADVEITAYVYDPAGDRWDDLPDTATTNARGRYALTGLADGTYRIRFDSPDHVTQYFPGVDSRWAADDVVLGESEARDGVDATMARATSISGRVTVPSGFDVEDVRASVYIWDEDQNRWHPDQSAWADVRGDYAFRGLAAGTYRVGFEAWDTDLISMYYPDVEDIDDSTSVTATVAAPATGVNASLVRGGRITGRVTVPSGADASDVLVSTYHRVADGYGGWDWLEGPSEYPQPDGTYVVRGVRPGVHVVRFRDYGGGLLTQYYPGVESSEAATSITIGGIETVGNIDATMVKGGSLSGKVTVPAGVDVGDVYVWSYRLVDGVWQGDESGWVKADPTDATGTTGTTGTYELDSLPAGSYRLEFEHDGGETATEFYNDAFTLESARTLEIGSGKTVSGVDIVLGLGGRIEGTVTVPAGIRAADVQVRAYALTGGTWTRVARTWAGRDGTYRVGGLRPGDHKLEFVHDSELTATEYYDDVSTLAAARVVAVEPGVSTRNIDATLVIASGGGDVPTPGVPTPGVPTPGVPTPGVPTPGVPTPGVPTPGVPTPGVPTPGVPAPGGSGQPVPGTEKPAPPKEKLIKRAKAPKVKGKAMVGKKLTATKGVWKPKSVKVKFQWFTKKGKKAVALKKATRSKLKVTKKLRGKKVRVKVTVTKPGYRTTTFTSKWSKKVA